MNLGLIPAKHAALRPRAQAVFDSTTGRRITFAQLDELVRRLANGLRGLGLADGARVAILSKNSIEFLALYYACARAGLIAQPMNWRLSPPAVASIIDDGKPDVFISSVEFRAVVDEVKRNRDVAHWLEYGEGSDGSFDALIDAASTAEPEWSRRFGGADPLFILYTGGTTGESKGALHSHTSAFMGMLNQTVAERIQPTSDCYMLTGQMFHIPVSLAMNYNAHGCPIVLMNFEPVLALELIQNEKVSGLLAITTMLNWMMAVENFASYDLSSLRMMQYGGGPLPLTVVKQAAEMLPCDLLGAYGQTEGTTMTFLSPEDHRAALAGIHPERLRSCGREGFITTLDIVDSAGRSVPRDGRTNGEIVIRSEANMLGYWAKPDLTAATVRDGWMHTGDVANWDEYGYVFIVDRAKDMIISGGENIYSAQVEDAIGKHEAVLECAVVGVPDDEWGEAVKAFVVLKPGTHATEADVIATARQHLASYQKPRSVEFLAELPKAPTGKILKRELRAPYWADRERQV